MILIVALNSHNAYKSPLLLGLCFVSSGKHVREMYTPLNLTNKTGVCRGIPTFLIFDLKHRLWVLIRTAPAINVLSKNIKNMKIFPMKLSFFKAENILCIAWASFHDLRCGHYFTFNNI